MKKIILYTTSWPIKKALQVRLRDSGFQPLEIYQDEEALLLELSKDSSSVVIIDSPPHRKILLLTAIKSLSTSNCRAIICIWQEKCFPDEVIIKLTTNGELFTYTEFFKNNLVKLLSNDNFLSNNQGKVSEFSLANISSPKMMRLYAEKNKVYEIMQKYLYQELFMAGCSCNEITMLRLLKTGLTLHSIAEFMDVQLKTIYTYRANIVGRIGQRNKYLQKVIDTLFLEKNQETEHFDYIYKNRCNNTNFECVQCPLMSFCFPSHSSGDESFERCY